MDFLGVGPLELIFVVLIALIVLGPRDIGRVARSAGRALNRLYRSETWKNLVQASRSLRTLPDRLAREADLDELDTIRKDLDSVQKETGRELHSIQDGLESGRPPRTGPPPPPSPEEGTDSTSDPTST